jgi:hypothetical protein
LQQKSFNTWDKVKNMPHKQPQEANKGWYPITQTHPAMRLDGSQRWSGYCGEERNFSHVENRFKITK